LLVQPILKTKRPPPARADDDLTVKLIARFKQFLATGVLVPGSKLPPERELALRLGVSRGSLRQALKVLVIMGVLTQRVGQGTFLAETATTILSEPLDFLMLFGSISHYELFEARMIIEPELAARAAERAMTDDLHILRTALRAMEKAGENHGAIVESDLAFHTAIQRAAGNRVCESMLSTIHRALSATIGRIAAFTEAGTRQQHQFHAAIYTAISQGDPEAARRAMIEHLLDARNLMLQAGAGMPLANDSPAF
jgi:GntR family transcriptional repressor for pyruvate dehydrogenase complex